MSHRFILLPYKTPASRKTCPACGAKREFAPYLDTETNELLPDHVGRCNRELHCGYHYTPKQFFEDNKDSLISVPVKHTLPTVQKELPISFIEFEKVEQSAKGYNLNNFFLFLVSLFGRETAVDLAAKYFIGTSKHWPGSTIFWQIDTDGNVRTGKIMHYDAITGKRTREPYDKVTWVHSVLKLPEFNLKQCFFGEHLLNEALDKTVCITESEKTAVICSVYFPKFIWIATGGKNGCKWSDKTVSNILKHRKVVLYPDANAFNDWLSKANKLHDFDITVSDYLEKKLTDDQKQQGLDIIDIILNKTGATGATGAKSVQQPETLHLPCTGAGARGYKGETALAPVFSLRK